MNREAAARFVAGMLAGWMGYTYIDLTSLKKSGLKKPKAAEREIFDRFGENVALAYELAADELERLGRKVVKMNDERSAVEGAGK